MDVLNLGDAARKRKVRSGRQRLARSPDIGSDQAEQTITTDQIQGLTRNVYGHDSDKIGSIGQIHLDYSTGTPNWVTVKTGLFGSAETFVPLHGARADGDDLYVDFARTRSRTRPASIPAVPSTPAEEEKLYAYCDLSDSDADRYCGQARGFSVHGSGRRVPADADRPMNSLGSIGIRAPTLSPMAATPAGWPWHP